MPRQVHSVEERVLRKQRVEAARRALRDSAALSGAHVPAARAALKTFLRNLNEPHQPSEAIFDMLIKAPFAEPRERRPR